MLYVTSYLLILTQQGPFLTPRNPSCYGCFIFLPPHHSPFLTERGRAAPARHPRSTLLLLDRQTDLPGQWHNVCHPSPPSCTSLLPAGAEGRQGGSHQLPASDTRFPPPHGAQSYKGRQPKGIAPLPHSLTLGGHVSPTPSLPPSPGGFAAASQGEGLGVMERQRLLPAAVLGDGQRERLSPWPPALPGE